MFIPGNCPANPVVTGSSVAGAMSPTILNSGLAVGSIAEGRTVLRSAPWLSILPGLALALTVVGVYLAGEGITNATSRREVQS